MNNITSILLIAILSSFTICSELISQNYLLNNESAFGFNCSINKLDDNSEFDWASNNITAFKIESNYTYKGKLTLSGSYNQAMDSDNESFRNLHLSDAKYLDLEISYKLFDNQLNNIPVNFLLISGVTTPLETYDIDRNIRIGSNIFHTVEINNNFNIVPIFGVMYHRQNYISSSGIDDQNSLNLNASINLSFNNTFLELGYIKERRHNRYEMALGYVLN